MLDAWRRRGIGRALLERAEAYARSLGMDAIGIGVMAGNRNARALYEARDYHEVHVELRKSLA